MQTLQLKISDKVYDKFISILNRFSKDEIEIVENDIEFQENKQYLHRELQEIDEGKAILLEEEEVYNRLEKVIQKYEDNL